MFDSKWKNPLSAAMLCASIGFSSFAGFMVIPHAVASGGDDSVAVPQELADQLAARFEANQEISRQLIDVTGPEEKAQLRKRLARVNADNVKWLGEQIDKYGWLSSAKVGGNGEYYASSLVRLSHGDKAFETKCLAAMMASKNPPQAAAFLADRLQLANGLPQKYGTKVELVDGRHVAQGIEASEDVDLLRATVGLGPLQDALLEQDRIARLRDGTKRAVPSFWTPQRRELWGQRWLDNRFSSGKLFEEDLASHHQHPPTLSPALSAFPSPVPTYGRSFGSLSWPKFSIGNKTVHSTCLMWARCVFNEELFQNPDDELRVYFNILVLTDKTGSGTTARSMSSRNYPHILSTGKQLTSLGSVDWVHSGLADGSNYAFINQRIFDLSFGRTILVAPQKDGSLRFMQRKSPDSCRRSQEQALLRSYLDELQTNAEVIEFFTQAGTLGH